MFRATWTTGRRGALLGASAAVVCLGSTLALTACAGQGGGGYAAIGPAGGPAAPSATAVRPTGGVTLVPLDGGGRGGPAADGGPDSPAGHGGSVSPGVTSPPGTTASAPLPPGAHTPASSDPSSPRERQLRPYGARFTATGVSPDFRQFH